MASPQESEAEGFLEVDFKGFTVRTSLPDQWPLHLIRQGRIIDATQELLGGRWAEFLDSFPSFGDLVEFTRALAEAAGIPGENGFGGIPVLLHILEHDADELERHLSANHHVNLVDYYRGELTLSQIAVRFEQPWTRDHFLLADLIHVISGRPHPDRPLSPLEKARVEAAAADQKRHEDKLHARETQYSTAAEKARENAMKAQQKGKHA
jgi:hypothetical protein